MEVAAARAYQIYQDELKKNQTMDFDDLIMKTIQLFESSPETLEFYQRKFRYIHVDEYQDTNEAQYRLVNMLAQGFRNLCVVGDADQSIYGWRGANMENILNFEKDYKDATVIKLEQNYRSTKTILQAANEVIEHNLNRKDKTLWTENESGDKITYYRADNAADEGYFVIDDTCTHGAASLSEGDIVGCEIECPFHSGRFDIRTGAATAFPCVKALMIYPVKVEGDEVYAALDAGTRADESTS